METLRVASMDSPIGELTLVASDRGLFYVFLPIKGRGMTESYAGIARIIRNPQAARAVGAACGANPIPIIIPCHRIVGRDGSLTGFAGGLPMKQKLLDLEKSRL